MEVGQSTRQELLKLVGALGAREAALRRDECGDWRVLGEQGHIYAVPGTLDRPKTPGFQIFVECETMRQWTAAKSALKPFAEITNDGDVEGMLFLDRLPTADEAGLVRRYVGIRKKRELSEETLASLRERGSKSRFQPRPSPSSGPKDE